MIFSVGIVNDLRPSALMSLNRSMFQNRRVDDEDVWVVTAAMGSLSGSSKTDKSGWSAVGEAPRQIMVFNEWYCDGKVNFF